MSTYAKITDFAAKDALLTGNPSKIVKGTEIGAEFDSIASADASNVKGPTSAVTDNAVVRWDTTTGRIAQGSSVTIDDTGNISGTSFTGAHNGTVGATTPSTGAFTTLSASSTANLNGATNLGGAGTNDKITISGGATGTGSFIAGLNNAGAAYAPITLDFGTNFYVRSSGSNVGVFSGTGLSVTGALSASGQLSQAATANDTFNSTNAALKSYSVALGAGLWGQQTLSSPFSYKLQNCDSTFVSTFPIDLNPLGGNVLLSGGKVVASSTGLAVTGALSATGNATVGNGVGLSNTILNGQSAAGLGAQISLQKGGVAKGYIGHESALAGSGTSDSIQILPTAGASLQLGSNNAINATLDTSGNLGLGVTPSAWNGGVRSIEITGQGYGLSSNGAATYLNGNTNYNTGWRLTTAAAATQYAQVGGQHVWYNAPTGSAGALVNGTGNFTQAMTLDASGNLLVGQTSAGAVNGNGASINPNGSSSNVQLNHISGAGSGTGYAAFNYNATLIGSITQSGTTAVAYNTTSDHRLKTNVRDANAARFMDIQFRDFEWVDGRHDCGVIAHELQAVYPDLVLGAKDATEVRTVEITPAVPEVKDEEGNVVTPAVPAVTEQQTFPVYQQVNYIGLICRMGTRIQQQQRLIESQAAAIAAIEARLAAAGIA